MITHYLIFYVGLAMAISLIVGVFLRTERTVDAYLGNVICGSFGSWIASYLFSPAGIGNLVSGGMLVLGIPLSIAAAGAVAGVLLNTLINYGATAQYKKSLVRAADLRTKRDRLRARKVSSPGAVEPAPPATIQPSAKKTTPRDILVGPGGFKKAS